MVKIHRLSALEVQRTTRLGFIADGGGLYLRARASGAKTWVFRSFRNGKPRDITLGHTHTIGLSLARQLAADMRLAIVEGRDPKAAMKRDPSEKTFKDAAVAITERRRKS